MLNHAGAAYTGQPRKAPLEVVATVTSVVATTGAQTGAVTVTLVDGLGVAISIPSEVTVTITDVDDAAISNVATSSAITAGFNLTASTDKSIARVTAFGAALTVTVVQTADVTEVAYIKVYNDQGLIGMGTITYTAA